MLTFLLSSALLTAVPDSSVADTAARAAAGAVVDSAAAAAAVPPGSVGSLLVKAAGPDRSIDKREWQMLDYVAVTEIMERFAAVAPRTTGLQGLPNTVFAYGANMSSALWNGRTLMSAPWALPSIDLRSPEFAESIEVLAGTSALQSPEAAGYAVNLREPVANSGKPYTKLTFTQGGGGLTSVDGAFVQNITRATALQAGFRRMSADGELDNQQLDNWELRLGTRTILAPRQQLSVLYRHTSNIAGANGGLDVPVVGMSADRVPAVRLGRGNEQRLFASELTATYRNEFGRDSASSMTLNAWGVRSLREFDRLPDNRLGGVDTVNLISGADVELGASARFVVATPVGSLTAGGEYSAATFSATPWYGSGTQNTLSGYGLLDLPFAATGFSALLGARIAVREIVSTSWGARLAWQGAGGASAYADLSLTYRLPSWAERSASSGERHLLALAGVRLKPAGAFTLDATAFFRRVADPVIHDTVASVGAYAGGALPRVAGAYSSLGLSLLGEFSAPWFVGSATAVVQSLGGADEFRSAWPGAYVQLYASYRLKLRRSELRAGIRLRGMSSFAGARLIPQTWAFVPNDAEQPATGNGVDLIGSIKVGTAFIRLSWNNLFSSSYAYVQPWAMPASNFRVGISWAFLE